MEHLDGHLPPMAHVGREEDGRKTTATELPDDVIPAGERSAELISESCMGVPLVPTAGCRRRVRCIR
jgi:hypothetical protein